MIKRLGNTSLARLALSLLSCILNTRNLHRNRHQIDRIVAQEQSCSRELLYR